MLPTLDWFQPKLPLRMAAGVAVLVAHAVALGLWMHTAGSPVVPPSPLPFTVALLSESPAPRPTPAPARPPSPALVKPRPVKPRPQPAPVPEAPAESAPVDTSETAAPENESATPASSTTTNPVATPQVISPPRFDAAYLNNPAPPYPPLSRRMKEQGVVQLRVKVTPEGHAAQVELKRSSGYQRLDLVALDTVRSWRFVPARQGSTSVAAWVVVPIAFSFNP